MDGLVEKDHRSSQTATHKEDNQKISHAPTSLHNGSPVGERSNFKKIPTITQDLSQCKSEVEDDDKFIKARQSYNFSTKEATQFFM